MPLIRSVFWLGLAFMVVGPQIDYSGAISSASSQVSESGQQMLDAQTDITTCSSINCVGQKIAITAGIDAVTTLARSVSSVSENTPALLSPTPHPRLTRSS